MLFPKIVLQVAKAAAKEKTRYALNGVGITTDETGATFIATDGHRLAEVRVDRDRLHGNPDDYPNIDGVFHTHETEFKALVPAKAFADLGRRLPVPNNSPKPVLENIVLEETREDENKVRFVATDLEQTGIVELREVEGNFPETEEVIPRSDTGRMVITLNPQYLREALELVEACTPKGAEQNAVVLSFATKHVNGEVTLDDESSIVLRGGKNDGVQPTAVVMPVNKG